MTRAGAGGSGPERTTWVRREAEPGEAWLATGIAVVAAAAVGGTILYLARMFIARDELPMRPRAEEEGSRG